MQNSGLNAGDITNGAHSQQRNTTKKNTSSDKGGATFSEIFKQAFSALKDAESAAKADSKKQAAADNLVDSFVTKFREADGDTQLKIAENLKKQNLKDIMRPEIYKPEINNPELSYGAHTPERSSSSNSNSVNPFGNPWRQAMDAVKKADEERANDGNSFYDIMRKAFDTVKDAADKQSAKDNEKVTSDPVDKEEDVVEYTYKPGDTFGQVLMKIGLSDGRNLWGPNGDVEYYRKQLHDQGLYGNIPIGKTIRLRRRK